MIIVLVLAPYKKAFCFKQIIKTNIENLLLSCICQLHFFLQVKKKIKLNLQSTEKKTIALIFYR